MASHTSNYDPVGQWVAPAKNFRTSARLHLQHYLFQNTIGFLLEPDIEKALLGDTARPLKVADLGCGNGIWLTELHSYLTGKGITSQLDGFDVNPVNFPHAAFLPDSVSLQKLDVLAKPMPAELKGIYDVVHIRAFITIIPNGDPTPILTVASELLKPGGHLQWEETRGDKFIVESPSPQISKSTCEAIVQILHAGSQARGIRNDWLEELDTHLSKFGFQDARMFKQEKRKQDYKGWTEDYLMVWEEIAGLFPLKAEAPDAPLSRETWVDMFAKGVMETENGVVVHQGKAITAVGQKPQ